MIFVNFVTFALLWRSKKCLKLFSSEVSGEQTSENMLGSANVSLRVITFSLVQPKYSKCSAEFYFSCNFTLVYFPSTFRYSWVSRGHFAVNLSGGQPKMY